MVLLAFTTWGPQTKWGVRAFNPKERASPTYKRTIPISFQTQLKNMQIRGLTIYRV